MSSSLLFSLLLVKVYFVIRAFNLWYGRYSICMLVLMRQHNCFFWGCLIIERRMNASTPGWCSAPAASTRGRHAAWQRPSHYASFPSLLMDNLPSNYMVHDVVNKKIPTCSSPPTPPLVSTLLQLTWSVDWKHVLVQCSCFQWFRVQSLQTHRSIHQTHQNSWTNAPIRGGAQGFGNATSTNTTSSCLCSACKAHMHGFARTEVILKICIY
jgi:hypothetical protein